MSQRFLQRSFAQLGADRIIEFLLGRRKDVTYIDIGCLWPVEQSTTYFFYENGGRGLCIDPNPDVGAAFRLERPRDTFVHAGVAAENGELSYHMFALPVYNTFSTQVAAKLEGRWRAGRGEKFRPVETRRVPVKRLADIVAESGFDTSSLDVLAIDTEGFEDQILSSLDFRTLRPKVICFEHIPTELEGFNPFALGTVRRLADQGYHLAAFTGHDIFMRRNRS